MPEKLIPVCASEELHNSGLGKRVMVNLGGAEDVSCFVIRHQGQVYGYFNQCQHLPVELDWNHGEFLDKQGQYLICATHGALYEPHSGYCVAGPCAGKYLRKLKVLESNQQVFIQIDG